MRANNLFAARPSENRETLILRRHQGDGVLLILNKLRRRKVPRAAELFGMGQQGRRAFDGLRDSYALDRLAPLGADDFERPPVGR